MQPLSPSTAIVYSLTFLFVGWLLGLLSPKIVDAIGKGYRRREIRKALFVELTGLRDRLVGIAAAMEQRSRSAGTGFSQMRFGLPFLESQVPSLTLFSADFQRRALELTLRLQNLNLLADSAWFYFTKTFDSPMEKKNLEVAKQNAEQTYAWIGGAAREMADLIGQLLALEA